MINYNNNFICKNFSYKARKQGKKLNLIFPIEWGDKLMKMRSKQGASLSQYGIIIVLIALAIVPVFFIFGKTIVESFENFNTNLKSTPPSGSGNPIINNAILNGTVTAGQLNGKPDNPKLLCHQSKCSIDYGEFVLNGLPENYGDFVQSSGNSGGTDMLATMFEQLAKTFEEKGDFKHAGAYTSMANLAHLTSDFQSGIESASNKALQSNTTPEDILIAELNDSNFCNVLETYPMLDSATKNMKYSPSILQTALMTRPDYAKTLNGGTPGSNLKFTYQEIMNDDKISETMKKVTKELYSNLSELAYNSQAATASALNIAGNAKPEDLFLNKYDLFTGTELTNFKYTIPAFDSSNQSQVLTSFLKDNISAPKTSNGINLNNNLVNISGK